MANKLVRWVAVGIGAITIFWLGYALGRVQNIGDLSRLNRDADVDRYSISRGGVLVHFERLGGDGKPYIRTADGVELLDLSDWDSNSRITVDGSTYDLAHIYPTSSVDHERYRIAETLHGSGWLLEREIDLEADGTVSIDHTFVAQRPVRRVDLSVAHVHAYFQTLNVESGRVDATVNSLTQQQVETGASAPAKYRILVAPAAGGPAPVYRPAASGILGASAFVADYGASNPAQDQRTLLGKEVVRIERVA